MTQQRRNMSQALQTPNLTAAAADFIAAGKPQSTLVEEVKASTEPTHEQISQKPLPSPSAIVSKRSAERKKSSPEPIQEGLVTLTVRVPASLPGPLIKAAADRKANRKKPFTQQEIVTEAIRDWLKREGYGESM